MNPKILGWSRAERGQLRVARRMLRTGAQISTESAELLRRYWRELKRRKKEFAPDARINPQFREWCELVGRDPKERNSWRLFVKEGRQ